MKKTQIEAMRKELTRAVTHPITDDPEFIECSLCSSFARGTQPGDIDHSKNCPLADQDEWEPPRK